jgi:tetratricopeptide (TPR) repeat protein
MPPIPPSNPFPGLRPFEAEDDHLFFGREREIGDLLRRLGSHRFLSVTGTSGSGKSSLVRSGLIPSLHAGSMVKAGSSWRIAVMRPGEDPLGHLAAALDHPDVLGQHGELASTSRVLLEATLRRGSLGVVDAVRHAHLFPFENILIVVDQFEELFRFRGGGDVEHSRSEAMAFVKLLLEATLQKTFPVYVVLTMRSDFLGDCMRFPGLPEAVNEGQYLVPRMTRDDLRLAITGPVAVAGEAIAPRLVLRLLNDVGDNQDELPLLQHVLMRTWDYWAQHNASGTPLDLADYEAVGTLKHALSMHAEEAYEETGSDRAKNNTERIFRALTDTFTDPRGVRRPTSVADLSAICEVPQDQVIEVVEVFRRPGRSFLMPPASVPLTPKVVVDLSHESLMRGWSRLITWAQMERASTALYVRLSREATWYEEGAAGLWDDPELELGLKWRRANRPTAAWARRYGDSFDRAMQFLDRSEQQRERMRMERRSARLRRLVLARSLAAFLLVVSLVIGWLYRVARREGDRAEKNLGLATQAVGQLLVATDRNQKSVGADVPEMEQFRRELLQRAKPFYDQFIAQQPDNERFVTEMGFAHFRLGEISRMLDAPQDAEKEYRAAISLFDTLVRDHPGDADYRSALANAYGSLGELLRPSYGRRQEAEKAYSSALALQTALTREFPSRDDYQEALARTHYNRGILFGAFAEPNDDATRAADADFREAIRLLEPVAQKEGAMRASQDLARVYNNLAALLLQSAQDAAALQAAKPYYERAIATHERLAARDPRNREFPFELAKFRNNYAELLRELHAFPEAKQQSERALALLNDLVRPAPSLGIERADAHNLRGRILQSDGSPDAIAEYREALTLFQALARTDEAAGHPDFHMRYGDLLTNLAALRREQPDRDEPRRLLGDAVATYVEFGRRQRDGRATEAAPVAEALGRLLPELNDADRAAFTDSYDELRKQVGSQTQSPR